MTTRISSTPIWSTKAHNGWVNVIYFEHMKDSDSDLLLSGGNDGKIFQYDINTGEKCAEYIGHTS